MPIGWFEWMRVSWLRVLVRLAVLVLAAVGAAMVVVSMGGCAVGPDSVADVESARAHGLQDSQFFGRDAWSGNSSRPLGQVMVDIEGFNKQAGGQFHDMALVIPLVSSEGPVTAPRTTTMPDGTVIEESVPIYARAFSSDPSNSNLSDLRTGFNESGFFLDVGSIGRDNASVISAYNAQLVALYEAQGKITAEQASVAREAIQAGASIAEALARAGVDLFGP